MRQGGVVEAQAEFDIALLGAVGEVRAAHQQEVVVDAEELGVARHRALPVLGRAGAHDDGAAQPPGHLARAQARGAPRRRRRSPDAGPAASADSADIDFFRNSTL